jgi:hypothetical protein
LYSACHIVNRLDSTRSSCAQLFTDADITRSNIREKLFRLMFDHLWTHLRELCSNYQKENTELWTQAYTFISKYYPSDKVLSRIELMEIRDRIDFMKLAHVILLNEQIENPTRLVSDLIETIHETYVVNRGPREYQNNNGS